MNSFTLQLKGKSELPEILEVNKDYLISVNATITNIDKGTDDQGGFIYTHKAKMRTCEILKDNGEIVITKVKGSPSQMLRNSIIGRGEDYEIIMGGIRANLSEVISLIKKLDGNK